MLETPDHYLSPLLWASKVSSRKKNTMGRPIRARTAPRMFGGKYGNLGRSGVGRHRIVKRRSSVSYHKSSKWVSFAASQDMWDFFELDGAGDLENKSEAGDSHCPTANFPKAVYCHDAFHRRTH